MSASLADDEIALVRLPDPGLAPGYRESLSVRTDFGVDDFRAGIVAVAPAEGAGATTPYFEAQKICDAGSDLSDPMTWEPLRKKPPRRREDIDPEAYLKDMLRRGKEIVERNPSTECQRPSRIPQGRPSNLPTRGHDFSPPVAIGSPRLNPSVAAA